ncbi:Sushi, von Willebrand factor type A, EGF and pentraxin domain-containing protein 1 [Eumeta japonica]|uniref:Sushi, von Willebrand factor type A, EGF and pentraxin domain-containing protein 1 n=1 Tax=Eumeta variegata TaxID=151549 RepID=A0A4C1UKQ5_EUMVA|nr:Sushi, von Willebrand factor type A, EGF and pentraxin domain-containing protein 1 [Eumeta japonica]
MPAKTALSKTLSQIKKYAVKEEQNSHMNLSLKDKVKISLIGEKIKAIDVVKQVLTLKWKWSEFLDAYGDSTTIIPGNCSYPRIDHGRIRLRQRARLVKFLCLGGYELVGNKYATCRDGVWDVPLPVCVKPGCSPLPHLKNGMEIPLRKNAWVIFFCMPGYRLEGSSAIYCDGKRWNDTLPSCVGMFERLVDGVTACALYVTARCHSTYKCEAACHTRRCAHTFYRRICNEILLIVDHSRRPYPLVSER